MELVFGYTPQQIYPKKCPHPGFSNQIVSCVAEVSLEVLERRKISCPFTTELLNVLFVKDPVNIFIMKSETNLISHFLQTGKDCTVLAKKFPREKLEQTKKCRNSKYENVLYCTSAQVAK